ncbi:hypothetical protein GCM10009531_53300 [Actinoplanes capillaceus]
MAAHGPPSRAGAHGRTAKAVVAAHRQATEAVVAAHGRAAEAVVAAHGRRRVRGHHGYLPCRRPRHRHRGDPPTWRDPDHPPWATGATAGSGQPGCLAGTSVTTRSGWPKGDPTVTGGA